MRVKESRNGTSQQQKVGRKNKSRKHEKIGTLYESNSERIRILNESERVNKKWNISTQQQKSEKQKH